MRKILLFFLCFMFAVTSCFADSELSNDGTVSDNDDTLSDNADTKSNVVVDITSLLTKDSETSSDEVQQVEVIEPVLLSTDTTLQSVSANDTTGFKSVLLSVLGSYDTVVTDYTYQSGSGYTSHTIDIEQDWAWICSCGVFALLLYCTFRAIGGCVARF